MSVEREDRRLTECLEDHVLKNVEFMCRGHERSSIEGASSGPQSLTKLHHESLPNFLTPILSGVLNHNEAMCGFEDFIIRRTKTLYKQKKANISKTCKK